MHIGAWFLIVSKTAQTFSTDYWLWSILKLQLYSARNTGKIAERGNVLDEFQKHAVEPKTWKMSTMYSPCTCPSGRGETHRWRPMPKQKPPARRTEWWMEMNFLDWSISSLHVSQSGGYTDVHECEHVLNCTFRITFLLHVNNILVKIDSWK